MRAHVLPALQLARRNCKEPKAGNGQLVCAEVGCAFWPITLRFNCTSMLECVFGVPRTRACHIHGIARGRQSMVCGLRFTPGSLMALWRSLAGDSRAYPHFKLYTERISTRRRASGFCDASWRSSERARGAKDVFVIGFSMSEPDVDQPGFLVRSDYPSWEYEGRYRCSRVHRYPRCFYGSDGLRDSAIRLRSSR